MAYRTRVFVDFWNFSLQWRDRANGAYIDWTKIPVVLLKEGEKKLQVAGLADELHLEETPGGDARLRLTRNRRGGEEAEELAGLFSR